MFDFLDARHRQPEWMDADDADPDQLRRSLAFIRAVNAWLGYTRGVIAHFERFSRGWKPGERIDVIDFATGSADIPRAILAWAARRGFDVRIVGVERHATTAAAAAAAANRSSDGRLRVVQADVLDLPFADRSFDYAITALFLHHLSEEQAVLVLATMDRVARRGVVAADLLRHKRAYAWIKLLTLAANPMVKHDAAASVAQAFSRDEVLAMRDAAGLAYATYARHFGHRFSLAGERPQPDFRG